VRLGEWVGVTTLLGPLRVFCEQLVLGPGAVGVDNTAFLALRPTPPDA